MRIGLMMCALLMLTQVSFAQRREGRTRDRDRSTYTPQSVNHSDTGDFAQDYSVFQDVNIFVRERHARRSSRDSAAPPRTPEQTFVLTGIVQDDNQAYHANFENLSSGSLVKVSVGNSLARGKISAIEKDEVAYEASGNQTWVQIGNNLTGANGGVSDGPPTGGAIVDPNAPGLTVEQRMRARRAQQMNGGGTSPGSGSSVQPSNGSPNIRPSNALPSGNYNGPPQENTVYGQSASINQAGGVTVTPGGNAQGGNAPVPADGAAPANGQTSQNASPSNDPTEPVITHNFPALPGDAPPPPPGN